MIENRKHISRRLMKGLKPHVHTWVGLGDPPLSPLSLVLQGVWRQTPIVESIFFTGAMGNMTREWMVEPLSFGWEFAKSFVFKSRTVTYRRREGDGREISVRLIGHRGGWFPDCEDRHTALAAYMALEDEWTKETKLPLLSSPAATGKALLWESLPRDPKTKEAIQFPCLDDDLAQLIRRNSPQHRIEWLQWGDYSPTQAAADAILPRCFQYDGRWMYAAMCGLDRFPVGDPHRLSKGEGFHKYVPGWYDVEVKIPEDWNHIGLIPALYGDQGWQYPNAGGYSFRTWAAEPELTLALENGWSVKVFDGYAFDKGRPLDAWAKTLIDMRAKFQKARPAGLMGDYNAQGELRPHSLDYAAAAVRQILNHCIGAIHVNGYEREKRVSESDWKQWRRDNAAWLDRHDYERGDDGSYIVSEFVPSQSPLDVYMPHWSSTLYSLARARVAQWALMCDGKEGRPGPEALVKIHGDAIYSTVELPFADNGKLGQLRRKES